MKNWKSLGQKRGYILKKKLSQFRKYLENKEIEKMQSIFGKIERGGNLNQIF